MSEIWIRIPERAKEDLDEVMAVHTDPDNGFTVERLFRNYIRGSSPSPPQNPGSGLKAYSQIDKSLRIDGYIRANGLKLENSAVTELPIGEEKEGIAVSMSGPLWGQLVRCAAIEAAIRRLTPKGSQMATVTDFAKGLVLDGLKTESTKLLDAELDKEDEEKK